MIKKDYPGAMAMKLQDMSHSGYPDLLVLYKSKCYFFELKVGKNKTSKIQDYFIQAIQKTGCFACVARDLTDIKQAFGDILQKDKLNEKPNTD